MAGIGTVIAGALAGGALFGSALAWVDPLGARKPKPARDQDVRDWSGDAIQSVDEARAILSLLGYSGPNAVAGFQRDASEVLVWSSAAAAGEERLPPASAGFTQTPPALARIEAGAPLSGTAFLDERTVEVLANVLEAVVFASGKQCMTDAGAVIEADATACRAAWDAAFRYAYEGNLAAGAPAPGGAPGSPGFQQRPAEQLDDWQEPVQNIRQEWGQYGAFRWVTYKDEVGRADYKFYYKTWRTGEGLGEAQGPFDSAAQAKEGAFAYMADQLGQNQGQGGGGGALHTGRLVAQPPGGGDGGGGVGGGLGG